MRLSSGEVRVVRKSVASGAVSNLDNSNQNLGRRKVKILRQKANSCGVVMNPIDSHGGGEGRTSGGRHPVTLGQAYKGANPVQ